jgi:hypothetical protein
MTKRQVFNVCRHCGQQFRRCYSHQIHCDPKCAFWENVTPSEGCWEWRGTVTSHGYGTFSFNGNHIRTHRYSYELHDGSIPTGFAVLHSCDNPRCCNPSHLRLGTAADNARDRQDRLRGLKKLTPEICAKALSLIASGRSTNSVAKEVGVWQGSLYFFLKRRGKLPHNPYPKRGRRAKVAA